CSVRSLLSSPFFFFFFFFFPFFFFFFFFFSFFTFASFEPGQLSSMDSVHVSRRFSTSILRVYPFLPFVPSFAFSFFLSFFFFDILHHFLFLVIFLGYDPLDTFSIFLVSLIFRCLRLMNS
ncbi:unnamed protein product, partial [Penicillium nalgiovense]